MNLLQQIFVAEIQVHAKIKSQDNCVNALRCRHEKVKHVKHVIVYHPRGTHGQQDKTESLAYDVNN